MKILTIFMCFLMLLMGGCDYININLFSTPSPNENQSVIEDQTQVDDRLNASPTPQAKISSNFENAPNAELVEEETGKNISAVLLQDTLTYSLPVDEYFAICLEEDAEQAYRWLLMEENEYITLEEETHLNGYRVFVFKPLLQGETSIVFTLNQNEALIETLNYQIVFS